MKSYLIVSSVWRKMLLTSWPLRSVACSPLSMETLDEYCSTDTDHISADASEEEGVNVLDSGETKETFNVGLILKTRIIIKKSGSKILTGQGKKLEEDQG